MKRLKYKFSTLQKEVLHSVNTIRNEHGLTPLKLNKYLCKAADVHSKNMYEKEFYAHGNFFARTGRYGYKGNYVGENIAVGYGSVDSVMLAWMNSEGHKANILNPRFKHLGVSLYHAAEDIGVMNYRYYWTQDFGAFI